VTSSPTITKQSEKVEESSATRTETVKVDTMEIDGNNSKKEEATSDSTTSKPTVKDAETPAKSTEVQKQSPMEVEENKKRKQEAVVSSPTTTKPAAKVDESPAKKTRADREVPPAKNPKTNVLFIQHFVRPFTKPAVETLLTSTGSVLQWAMDNIKSKAYVIYSDEKGAEDTRNALHNLVWPPANRTKLSVEYSTKQEADKFFQISGVNNTSTPTPNKTENKKEEKKDEGNTENKKEKREEKKNDEDERKESNASRRRSSPPPRPKATPKVDAVKQLDEVFKKTVAVPHLYWLPLTQEEIDAKLGKKEEKNEVDDNNNNNNNDPSPAEASETIIPAQ